ncbi:TPA: hypothetical protein N0F65_011864 [Lagenidium giganteum]|uniref:Uncharacterized protein n=1 Tax=Lagenidium giganteum TaxID=4803 RepID=A0AAV2YKT1_9STRA|nr:TPA: hypothetical protein N0F65_011864 [Lagenidium giganteum]
MMVFQQNFDLLMRETVSKIKLVIRFIMEGGEFQNELVVMCDVANLAAAKILESGDPPATFLKTYFAEPAGVSFCEQNALPSLLLDLLEKLRVQLVQQELQRLAGPTSENEATAAPGIDVATLERPMQFLFTCAQSIAMNTALMEEYRCELPNLIQLTAEEYPQAAFFLRDLASQMLACVSDKNFNAALVWYLHDCHTVGKTVRLITKYINGVEASPSNASEALSQLSASKSVLRPAESSEANALAAAAAVSDALGMTKDAANESVQSADASGIGSEVGFEVVTTPPIVYALRPYEAIPGLKTLIYVLQKTCRHSLVLLGEFQSSGGYTLLAKLIQESSGGDMSTLIYLSTLLLPLGTGFSGVFGEDENMATVITCGARNVGAFTALRDLLLKCVSELEMSHELTERDRMKDEQIILQILTTILHVYTSDYENFMRLEPKTQTLALILTKLPWMGFYDAKVIVLRIVEYVCAAAKSDGQVPQDILSILSSLFIQFTMSENEELLKSVTSTSDSEGANLTENPDSATPLHLMLCSCLTKILQGTNVSAYQDELRSCGLLERGLYALFVKIASGLSTPEVVNERKKYFLEKLSIRLNMWAALATSMLRDNWTARTEFRRMHIHQSLYAIADFLVTEDILQPDQRQQGPQESCIALSVFSLFVELANIKVIENDGSEDASTSQAEAQLHQAGTEADFGKILELVQSSRGFPRRQHLLLDVLKQMLRGNSLAWGPWQMCQGHEIMIATLSSLDNFAADEEGVLYLIMESILDIFIILLDPGSGDETNRAYFKQQVGYASISGCLINCEVLQTDRRSQVIEKVFELITGQASPCDRIKNADAVEAVFRLLAHLPLDVSLAMLKRLLLMLTSSDDSVYSTKRQSRRLVEAGIFRWFCDPAIAAFMLKNNPLKYPLMSLFVVLSKEELATAHLREFMRVIAKCMPKLLGNMYDPKGPNFCNTEDRNVEAGLTLFQIACEASTVPQTPVGAHTKSRISSGYIHITNAHDRVWPPSSGYSFACWLRFPPVPKQETNVEVVQPKAPAPADGATVFVALCEGYLTINLVDDDAAEPTKFYGVLVGATLSLFNSSDSANRSEGAVRVVDVTAVARHSQLEIVFWSYDKSFVAKCESSENLEMWLRAMQQAQVISALPSRSKVCGLDIGVDEQVLYAPDVPVDQEQTTQLDGYACIVSIYSLESAGCFTRVFFDQSNGSLRIDTGSVSSGPNMNPNPKRTSVVFKNIDLNLLRSSAAEAAESATSRERSSDWHHIAFTHRKAVVGSSLLTLYIDGSEVTTKKLSYPSSSGTGTFQCFVGKDIQVCGTYPALPWSIGPAWLVEDTLNSNAIVCMFLLGPTFRGQFSGHSYRSVGDWPEALTSSLLERSTQRRVEIARAAKRLQLAQLSRASRRQWNDGSVNFSLADYQDSGKPKDDLIDGFRFTSPTSRKELSRQEAFQAFVKHDCSMSSFGQEILQLLSSFKLADDTVLFSLNTKFAPSSTKGTHVHTQVNYIGTEQSTPLDIARLLPSVGGVTQVLFPLFDNAWRSTELNVLLRILVRCLRRNPNCMAECLESNAYALLCSFLCERIHLIDEAVLRSVEHLAIAGAVKPRAATDGKDEASELSATAFPLVADFAALSQILFCTEIRKRLPVSLQRMLVTRLTEVIEPSNPNAVFNVRQFRRAGFLSWILMYISDLCGEKSTFDEIAGLDLRACYPQFEDSQLNQLLHEMTQLLRTYLRVENHIDDVNEVADLLLLSLTNDATYGKENVIRMVLLQFLLHEVEKDTDAANVKESLSKAASSGNESAQLLVTTMVEAVVYRAGIAMLRKRKERTDGGGFTSVTSPTSASTQSGAVAYAVDGFENVLLEIIGRQDSGVHSGIEALLATRLLLTLAQDYSVFAQFLLQTPSLLQKFKRVLQRYSTDCDFFTPLLAFVSNIPIKDTKYRDPVTSSDGPQQFALPTPCPITGAEKHCVDQVWDLLGALLLRNTRVEDEAAKAINITVFAQLSFQVEVNESFFSAVCKSCFTVLRLVVQCLVSSPLMAKDVESTVASTSKDQGLQASLSYLISGRVPKSRVCALAVACFDFLKVFFSRLLFEKDDFALFMLYFLDSMDSYIANHQPVKIFSAADGQKAWLGLLVHVVKSTKALSDNCSFLALRNVCSLALALSRYLVDETKHQGTVNGTESMDFSAQTALDGPTLPQNVPTCFGTDVLVFFLSSVRICSETHITHLIGAEDQQFIYGVLVYCAQTVVLNELNGAHKGTSPQPKLLECIVNSRALLVQQTKCSSVIVCGSSTAHHGNDSSSSGVTNPTLARMRTLSATFHKEFGVGSESDRSFILSLAAELFRMLLDDSESVRYSSILLWQFLIQQRMGVLKELLIVEPKASLLQNITANKKEVIDVFHGGFERLLHVHKTETTGGSSEQSAASVESWLQFHVWLTDHQDLLNDLILTRTEPIFQHMTDVLLSCSCVRKVNMNSSTSRLLAQGDLAINLDFVTFDAGNDWKLKVVEEIEFGYKTAARKTSLRLTNLKESSIDGMRDAQIRWRELLARLLSSRCIWQYGGWVHPLKEYVLHSDNVSSDQYVLERSIFHDNSVKYRLDFTEGPQRMRVRLLRSYDLPEYEALRVTEKPSNNVSNTTVKRKSLIDDSLKKSLEFHEAVEVYREYLYRQSTVADTSSGANVLREILSRCAYERTRETFVASKEEEHRPVTLARKIFDTHLKGSGCTVLAIPDSIVTEIEQSIQQTETECDGKNIVPLTLFDVADSEAMQNKLCNVKVGTDVKAISAPTTHVEEDDEEGEGDAALGIMSDGDDEDSDDQQDDGEDEIEVNGKDASSKTDSRVASGKGVTILEDHFSQPSDDVPKPDLPNQTGDAKVNSDHEDKTFDSSHDYVYGGIARFLHREDYPPTRCYSASYIAGMSKTLGVFLLCRNAVYFIGGYEKLYHNDADHVGSNNVSSPGSSSVPMQATGPISPTKSTTSHTGKKKGKSIIRTTLADFNIQFGPSKDNNGQFFTVVPLTLPQRAESNSSEQPMHDIRAPIKRWSVKYAHVRQFYRIKYQLRPVGIEFFDVFGSTFFLQFDSNAEREEILKLMFQMPIVNSIFWNPVLRSSAISLSIKRIRQGLTKRWLRGQMSNFEYLMHLNTIAGRSFNDITQYPVFPWVLTDYKSQFLDIDNPAVYRDLSKPMGALGQNRAAQFRERFSAMSHDVGNGPMDTPAFHYGTHYSCSAYVVNYLIRLEPFTKLALELQGGYFDHADRLFRSIPSSWESASTENLQDVRELIPEFYFLPEFLFNANNYDYGMTQSGEMVSHVRLPPWAQGDPREFVRLHRMALESKHVSENLHHWIDLIFGYQQTGQQAKDAQNVFMHITYEGTVDIEKIEDPIMRNAMLSQIENFGQTPSKLFTSPHPARKVPTLNAPTAPTAAIGHQYEGNTLSSIEAYVKWHTPLAPALVSIGKDYVFLKKQMAAKVLDEPIGDIRPVNDKFQCRGFGCNFMPPRFSKYAEWGAADTSIRFRVHQSSARYREANKVIGVLEDIHTQRMKCAAFSDDGQLLVTGGEDAVVNVIECLKLNGHRVFKQKAKLVGHEDAVVSVAINKEFNLIASGSLDCCVILWDLRMRSFLRELVGHTNAVTRVSINGANGNILTTTSSEIRVWSVNGDLLAATAVQNLGLSAMSAAIATRCDSWQNGVVAVTGHTNGTIALWGLLYPSDIALDKQSAAAESDPSAQPPAASVISPRTSMLARTGTSTGNSRCVMRVGPGQGSSRTAGSADSGAPATKVVPSSQLFIMKLLLDHRVNVTALTLGADQRQLLSGDADGHCIRWVDDSISTNIIEGMPPMPPLARRSSGAGDARQHGHASQDEEEVEVEEFEMEVGGSGLTTWATSFYECAAEGDLQPLLELLDEGRVEANDVDVDGFTALMVAAAEGHAHIVNALLERGADVSMRTHELRSTALHFAAKSGDRAIVEAICKQDAQHVDCWNVNGDTPLIWACIEGRAEAVEVLLSFGADVNAVNQFGATTLICAVMIGEDPEADDSDQDRAKILRMLLQKNAKLVNFQDREGSTAMHLAASCGYLECVKTLLELGADITLRNAIGQTPLEEAEQTGVAESGPCVDHLRGIWKNLEEEAAARMMSMLEMEEKSHAAGGGAAKKATKKGKKAKRKAKATGNAQQQSHALATMSASNAVADGSTKAEASDASSDSSDDEADDKPSSLRRDSHRAADTVPVPVTAVDERMMASQAALDAKAKWLRRLQLPNETVDEALGLLACGICGELVNDNVQCSAAPCTQLYCASCLSKAVMSAGLSGVKCIKCQLSLDKAKMMHNHFAQAQAASLGLSSSSSSTSGDTTRRVTLDDLQQQLHSAVYKAAVVDISPAHLVPGAELRALSVGQLEVLEDTHQLALREIMEARIANARVLERLQIEEWMKTQRDILHFAAMSGINSSTK